MGIEENPIWCSFHLRFSGAKHRLDPAKHHRENGGGTLKMGGPLIINSIQLQLIYIYIVGIHYVP